MEGSFNFDLESLLDLDLTEQDPAPGDAEARTPVSVAGNTPVVEEMGQFLDSQSNTQQVQQQYYHMYGQLYNQLYQDLYNHLYRDLYHVLRNELVIRTETDSDQPGPSRARQASGTDSSSSVDSTSRKRHRSFMSDEKYESLKSYFAECPQPTPEKMRELAADLGLHYKKVQKWFEHQRAFKKRKAVE